MNKLKVRKNENRTIKKSIRFYIDFFILICCLVITFNIHPINKNSVNNSVLEETKMIYVFHDFRGNEYILNDAIHGAASDWSYLFEDNTPYDVEGNGEIADTISIDEDNGQEIDGMDNEDDNGSVDNTISSVKDNQVSFENIISDLGINEVSLGTDDGQTEKYNDDNLLVIDLSDTSSNTNIPERNDNISSNNYYVITEETGDDTSNILVIERVDDNYSDQESTVDNDNQGVLISNTGQQAVLSAKPFSFIIDGRILPILIPWNQLQFNNLGMPIGYLDNSGYFYLSNTSRNNGSGVTIIDNYADCMTPWGYKIVHGDSVLAYKQMKDTPDICHIERRLCRNGKLSGTYTQQGCSINKGYTYEKRGEASSSTNTTVNKKGKSTTTTTTTTVVQRSSDGYTTVNKPLGTGSFVFDRPSQTSTPEYHISDNVRDEDIDIDQTTRPHWNCVTPRGEEVKHGQFVQAFKHSNGFSDAPCEAQIRLCSMGDLMGSYTESSCKTWDTSLIDWINGSPTRDTFSEEKLEWIRNRIKTEEKNYNKDRKKVKNITYDDNYDEILSILDSNN